MRKLLSFKSFHSIGIILLLLLVIPRTSNAQFEPDMKPQKGSFVSHLYFGGGFGLQFGSMTLIEIMPLVGYKITPKFSIGLSPTYKFYKYNDYYGPNLDLKTNVVGGSVFSRYAILENVFAHVEYETLFFNTQTPGYPTVMEQFNSFFVGGGYNQRIGVNTAMYIMMLWNLNDTPNSPYVNPIIRVGFSAGL
jgi:hypothetical protein